MNGKSGVNLPLFHQLLCAEVVLVLCVDRVEVSIIERVH